MNPTGPWTTADFDSLSWHDVHVHGLRLEAFDDTTGQSDLVLDIDFILDWKPTPDGMRFTICPAELRFHGVFALRITLDYAGPSAGTVPFSIACIERTERIFATGHRTLAWRIPVNWPAGLLEFEASGFTQKLTGTPHTQAGQCLPPDKRIRR